MKKRLITMFMSGILCFVGSTGVYASEDNSARIAEIEAQIVELQAELKELKGETGVEEGGVLYQDENIIITFDGIDGEEDDYDVKFILENLSDKTLTVQARETSINGFMVDPICSMEVAPGKKAKDGMSIWGEDAEDNPMSEVENIETKFHIFNNDDWEDYVDTENIVIK